MKPKGLHIDFARDPKYSNSMNISKIEFIAYIFTFYYKCLNIEKIYILGNKTILYLIFNRINGFVGV